MAGAGNSINEGTTGICGFTSTAFTATPATNHAVLVGGSTSSTLTNLALGTSGFVLKSNGASSDPSFQAPFRNSNGMFSVTTTISNVTGNGANYHILYDTTNYQNGTDITFSGLSTGNFTVNSTGVYWIFYGIGITNLTIANTSAYILVSNGVNGPRLVDNPGIHLENTILSGDMTYFASGMFSFSSGNTFNSQIQVDGGAGNTVDVQGQLGSPSFAFPTFLSYIRII